MSEKLALKIEKLIEKKQFFEIKKLLPGDPEDIVELISSLSKSTYKLFIFRMIPQALATDVFESLPIEEQEELLSSLTSQEIKTILNQMSPDERTELFEELPAKLVKKFLNFLSPDKRRIAIEILNYPENFANHRQLDDFYQ